MDHGVKSASIALIPKQQILLSFRIISKF